MKSRRRLERFSLNWSRSMAVSMARKTSGPRMSAKESLRSLASQSSSSLLAVCWLMSRASGFLEQLELAFVDQQAGEFAAELGGDGVQGVAQRLVPVLRVGRLERFQRAAVLGGRQLLHQRAELDVLRPDVPARRVRPSPGGSPAICAESSRTKIASSATAGCVR